MRLKVKEIYEFLDTHTLTRLNQDELNNFNTSSSITTRKKKERKNVRLKKV